MPSLGSELSSFIDNSRVGLAQSDPVFLCMDLSIELSAGYEALAVAGIGESRHSYGLFGNFDSMRERFSVLAGKADVG